MYILLPFYISGSWWAQARSLTRRKFKYSLILFSVFLPGASPVFIPWSTLLLFVTCMFHRPPSLQALKIKQNKLTIICEDYFQCYTEHSLKFPLRKKQKQTNNTNWTIERLGGRICARNYTMGSKHCVATWKQKFSLCISFSKFRTLGEYLKFWDIYTNWYGLLRFGNRTEKMAEQPHLLQRRTKVMRTDRFLVGIAS